MAETSGPWDGVAVGDAVRAPYNASEWDDQFEDMFNSDVNLGVLANRGGDLAGSILGANQFRIASGAALVKGKWYRNTANVDFAPVSATAGNWRRDRIVLSSTWANINSAARDPAIQLAQTIRLIRLINPAENAAAPAVTQTDGVLWEIPLYQINISDAGVVTIQSDDREFITVGTGLGARTRRFFVPAHGADEEEAWKGYKLKDAQTQETFGFTMVPEDFVSDMVVQTVIIPDATGNAMVYFGASYGACAQLWDTHFAEFNAVNQAIAVTLNQRNCIMSTPLPNAAIGDMINFLTLRDATDPADSVNAIVYCPGWLVTYTADS